MEKYALDAEKKASNTIIDEAENPTNRVFNSTGMMEKKSSAFNPIRTLFIKITTGTIKPKEIGTKQNAIAIRAFLRLNFFGEIGLGSYESSNVERSSGEAIVINLASPKEYTGVPIQIQYSRIAPEAVNVNSSFTNTSVSDLVQTTVIEEGGDPTIMTSFGGPVTNLGYLANNREGLSINTEFEARDFTISGGFGFYSESVSYTHLTLPTSDLV